MQNGSRRIRIKWGHRSNKDLEIGIEKMAECRNRRFRNSAEDASAITEAAILIPILLVLVFGIAQWGVILGGMITLRNATAVGARTATLNVGTVDERRAAAQSRTMSALLPMLDPANLVGTPQVTHDTVTDDWKVTVQYNMPLIVPFVIPGSGGVYVLSSSTTMR